MARSPIPAVTMQTAPWARGFRPGVRDDLSYAGRGDTGPESSCSRFRTSNPTSSGATVLREAMAAETKRGIMPSISRSSNVTIPLAQLP